MALTLPGTTLVKGPAFLDNVRVESGSFADSYFFDVSMRTNAGSKENGYLLCSLRLKSALDCTYMTANIFIITAKVNLSYTFSFLS